MNIKRLRAVCVKIYKTINKVNPNIMRGLLELRLTNRSVLEKIIACHIILNLLKIYYPSKEQLSIAMENIFSVKFEIAVTKLIFRSNVDLLFRLKLF